MKILKQEICQSVYLESLQLDHQAELYSIAQDERIWTFNLSTGLGPKFQQWFQKALDIAKIETQLAFVVRDNKTQELLGSTRLYNIDAENKTCAIGYTWYVPAVWGTKVNPQCKYLLLSYAFEELKFNRVEFATDSRNQRSRSAILKLGAQHEGTLRLNLITKTGHPRNTEVFSIIKTEWPSVKENLTQRLVASVNA